jgi:8-oxo-dGTP diphosphatase
VSCVLQLTFGYSPVIFKRIGPSAQSIWKGYSAVGIRNAAKAIIVHENKILLNRCRRPETGEYFTLPGGGQNQYETMEEAIIRECLEETGYTVIPEALVAVYEEINTNEDFRKKYPDYSHKIFYIFKCSLVSHASRAPSEQDTCQLGSVWVDINDIPAIKLFPIRVHDHFERLIQTETPLFLGSELVSF